jgi:hypothetical protein
MRCAAHVGGCYARFRPEPVCQVYRRTPKGLTLLSDGYRSLGVAGVYRVSQSHPQLPHRLTRGSYEVRVTPGYAKNDLGITRKAAFRIV